jgi:hypothetical protein
MTGIQNTSAPKSNGLPGPISRNAINPGGINLGLNYMIDIQLNMINVGR